MAESLQRLLREPQSWINLIGLGSVLALSLGAFEPAEPRLAQQGVSLPVDVHLAVLEPEAGR